MNWTKLSAVARATVAAALTAAPATVVTAAPAHADPASLSVRLRRHRYPTRTEQFRGRNRGYSRKRAHKLFEPQSDCVGQPVRSLADHA
jgi:hypothetical protein